MRIQQLKLFQYRNIEKQTLILHPNVNVIFGNNAQGKTNILESVFLLSSGRSFRCEDNTGLIKTGCEFAKIEVIYDDENLSKEVGCIIHHKGKQFSYNRNYTKRLSDFIGKLNAILFSPNDLMLFENAPYERRRFMDLEIGKCDETYLNQLLSYNNLLKQRNALLKNEHVHMDLLETITEQMIGKQVDIIQKRKKFFQSISSNIEGYYEKIASERIPIKLMYKSCIENMEEDLKKQLQNRYEKSLQRDLILKTTNVGIHREDFHASFNEQLVYQYASQGQKRCLILALKVALIDWIYEKKGIFPILLLDDVLSELDEQRRNHLFSLIPKQVQTIITTTDFKKDHVAYQGGGKIFEIKDGVVHHEEDNYE